MKLMHKNAMENRLSGRPARPKCRGSNCWPRSLFSVMQPMDIMYVKIKAAFDMDRIAPRATSEPKLMHDSRNDTPMQTYIAFRGWPYLTFVIHEENGKPPSLYNVRGQQVLNSMSACTYLT